MRFLRRANVPAQLLAFLVCLTVVATPAGAAVTRTELPSDFAPRFMIVCAERGLTRERCACMTEIVLREVADEHLVLMLNYFENPRGFDDRALDELDNDARRLAVLADEITAAQEAMASECPPR